MTDEEKKAAELAAKEAEEVAAKAKAEEDAKEANKDVELLTAKEAEIAKLKEERDNYKKVALKRLGKLPGDADFLSGEESTELSVAEQVRLELMNQGINKAQEDKDKEVARMAKENAELRLALKNRPDGAMGSGSGSTTEVKDNVFSPAQIEVLKAKAIRLKADPEKFIEAAKKNLTARA